MWINCEQVIRTGLEGCVSQVTVMTQATPSEVWTPLNWSSALTVSDLSALWDGCPLLSHDAMARTGNYFLGNGSHNFTSFWENLLTILAEF